MFTFAMKNQLPGRTFSAPMRVWPLSAIAPS